MKGIPFVFYTATYTDPRDEELALDLGAARFIVKPVEPDLFVGMLREVIAEAEAGRLVAPRKPIEEEPLYLKEYNERLVKKLEDKMVQLERAKRRLTALYEASTGLASLRPLEELVPHALRTVVEAMGFSNGSYFAYDEERQEFHLQEAVGFPDEVVATFRRELVFRLGEARGLVGLVGQTRQPVIVADTQADPRWITLDDTIRSALFVPVIYKGRLLGVANFLSTEPDAFDEEDVRNLVTMGNNLGIAIENARLVEDLRQSEERYRSLFENVPTGLYRTTPQGEILDANPALVQMLGYADRESVRMVNAADLFVNPQDRQREQTLLEREGVVLGFETQLRRRDGVLIWVRDTVRATRGPEGRVLYYEGSIEDITDRKRAEEELRESYTKLRTALGGTIDVLVSAVEMRDPYTAGHQRRVADLARSIATGMGLSKDQIEGIRMAGVIHDIGKISIPAEILSKPSRLNELERGLIKTHPEVSYNILSRVEFPWPVAEIVLQHHERLDGSGYPQGLSGEEILIETRILAVADVVEAMSSHRPYRPAHSIDKALEEISQNRGVLYDPEVVDACLKLFTEDGFEFE